jgi:hypothetical protein
MLSNFFSFCLCLAFAFATGPLGRLRAYGTDKNAAVASEVDVCSKIGISVIKSGGNAADAVRIVKELHLPDLMVQ